MSILPLFLGTRAVLLLIACLAAATTHRPISLAAIVNHDDTVWYAGLANGYPVPGSAPDWLRPWAFFPLWPGILHVTALPLSGFLGAEDAILLAGTVLANLLALLSCLLLARLVARHCGDQVALLAVTFLLTFPTTLFLLVPYTESLFLFLSLLAFTAAEEQRWLVAGCAVALAFLCRPPGMFLGLALLPLVLHADSWGSRLRHVVLFAAPGVIAFVGYALVARALTGLYLPFLPSETLYWGHHAVPPVYPFVRFLYAPYLANFVNGDNAVNALVAYLALALVIPAWRRFGAHWGLWLLLSVLFPLSSGGHYFLAFARYALVAFPLVAALAMVVDRLQARFPAPWRQQAEQLVLAMFLPLAGMWVVFFVTGVTLAF